MTLEYPGTSWRQGMHTAFYHDTVSVRGEQDIFDTKKSICAGTKGTKKWKKDIFKRIFFISLSRY